ncbi:MAG: hypothetical protein IPJ97_15975 [Proteobacteria bacterium]|nr:hypothetical protein [Pseudomonadota bacterium]
MNEKPESADEFEDEDTEEVVGGDEALDVDRLIKTSTSASAARRKARSPRGASSNA